MVNKSKVIRLLNLVRSAILNHTAGVVSERVIEWHLRIHTCIYYSVIIIYSSVFN